MRISDWSSDVCSSDLLSFNRFDKLTDISLKYEREMIDDPDQKMSLEDCRAIHERTADWLVKDFGAFEQKKEKGVEIVKTAKGSEYSYYLDGTTFIASFRSEEHTSELQSLMPSS